MIRHCPRCRRNQWVSPNTAECLFCDSPFTVPQLASPTHYDQHQLGLLHREEFGWVNLVYWWIVTEHDRPAPVELTAAERSQQ